MKESNITRRKFFDKLIRVAICSGFGYPIVIEPNWLVLEKVDVMIGDVRAQRALLMQSLHERPQKSYHTNLFLDFTQSRQVFSYI